jgi:hypothetical protein
MSLLHCNSFSINSELDRLMERFKPTVYIGYGDREPTSLIIVQRFILFFFALFVGALDTAPQVSHSISHNSTGGWRPEGFCCYDFWPLTFTYLAQLSSIRGPETPAHSFLLNEHENKNTNKSQSDVATVSH